MMPPSTTTASRMPSHRFRVIRKGAVSPPAFLSPEPAAYCGRPAMSKICHGQTLDIPWLVLLYFERRMKNIAVIGAGISGLAAAYVLSRRHRVQLFEQEPRLGGHTNTVLIDT